MTQIYPMATQDTPAQIALVVSQNNAGLVAANSAAFFFISYATFGLGVNLGLSQIKCRIAPTNAWSANVYVNGTVVGTVTFASGAVAGTINVASSTQIAAGQEIGIVPTTSDPTMADLSFTIVLYAP